ncbi:MAG: hypothetical protein EPN53_16075 [Acidobacteria bacterium]|nr:MAG: hypothetical protein EPN53_16075 [Acidobacteriota bacterium]
MREPTRRRQHLTLLLLVVGVAAAAFSVHGFWERELSHLTGPARWIWVTDELDEIHPEAALFVGSLHLDAPPRGALLKVCGDREYVVYVNGTAAACGWSRPGFRLDLFDVGHLLRQGDNVIAAEVRSPTPVGGLLLALDVDGVGRNVLVSGPAFRARSRFSLAPRRPSDAPVPVDWGRPPHFPWGYPKPLSHPRTLDEAVVEEPVGAAGAVRKLPDGGWELSLPHPVFGYLWVEFAGDGAAFVATAADGAGDGRALREDAQPVVRVPGQRRWLDPEPKLVRRIYIFGMQAPVGAELWPTSEDVSSTAPGVVPGSFGPVPRTRWTTRNPPE